MSLIKAVAVPGMRVGTVAVRDIAAEELYLSVPLALIMDVESAFKYVAMLREGPPETKRENM